MANRQTGGRTRRPPPLVLTTQQGEGTLDETNGVETPPPEPSEPIRLATPIAFLVMHDRVGDHVKGDRIPADALTEDQVIRLVTLDAIEPIYEG